jgi:hypothetical protein
VLGASGYPGRQGYTLKVYDCYRPQRAVDHFVRCAEDLSDERMKVEFSPDVDKVSNGCTARFSRQRCGGGAARAPERVDLDH